MKEIKAPLESRYKNLKITAACKNPDCMAGFELTGDDIRIHRKGNSLSYVGGSSLGFRCPHCGDCTSVTLEDKELADYILRTFDPVYYGEDE